MFAYESHEAFTVNQRDFFFVDEAVTLFGEAAGGYDIDFIGVVFKHQSVHLSDDLDGYQCIIIAFTLYDSGAFFFASKRFCASKYLPQPKIVV